MPAASATAKPSHSQATAASPTLPLTPPSSTLSLFRTQNTIASLKREIEKAWKMVDASHEKEARAKETIAQLKTEISNLSRLVERGAGLSVGQENTVNELMREKEELTAERDAQIAQIANLRSEIGNHLASMRQVSSSSLFITPLTTLSLTHTPLSSSVSRCSARVRGRRRRARSRRSRRRF